MATAKTAGKDLQGIFAGVEKVERRTLDFDSVVEALNRAGLGHIAVAGTGVDNPYDREVALWDLEDMGLLPALDRAMGGAIAYYLRSEIELHHRWLCRITGQLPLDLDRA